MKNNNINEEIINQLRLINFDRSKTLMEQSLRRVTLYGRIFNGVDNKPCDGCTVELYKNPNFYGSKLNNHPYYENLFKDESPMEKTTTYEGYYTIGEIDIPPGPYALVAHGGTIKDQTTIYINVINSGTITNNIKLYNYVQDVPIYTKFGGELGKVYNKWVQSVNKYNQLIDNNHTNNRYTYNFPDPQKVSADHKWTVNEMKGYVDGVQKSINDLNKTINKGEDYLKDVGKYINVTKLKPLDVVKEFGTTEGFSEMHGLYSIGGNAVNLWRDWMNNDGEYLDPKSVKLTPEQIEYIKQGVHRKGDNFLKAVGDFVTFYHDYSPYLALALWVIPGLGPAGMAVEAIDSILYLGEERYYMAGLTLLFAVAGGFDDKIIGPWGKQALREGVEKIAKNQTLNKTQKEAVKFFIKQTEKKVAGKALLWAAKFFEKLFNIMNTSIKGGLYVLKRLWGMKDSLPGPLKWFIETMSKVAVTIGGTIWTWDKLASYLGLCNEAPFSFAAEHWDDSDHWWISNLVLPPLVSYMGAFQTSTNTCIESKGKFAANEMLKNTTEIKRKDIKTLFEKETLTEEEKKEKNEYLKICAESIKKDDQNVLQAKDSLLSTHKNDSIKVIEDFKNIQSNYHTEFGKMQIFPLVKIANEADTIK
jgi:hypothetical protein